MRRKLQGRGFESRPVEYVNISCTLVGGCAACGQMPEELQPLKLVVAGSSPAPATRRQGSSAVEHENVSLTLVVRTPTNAEGITFPGRQCAGSSPAPALQDSPMGRDTTVNFFNSRCRAFEFLVRWFYRRTATVLRMNAGRITSQRLHQSCLYLSFVLGECRQDYNLSCYLSCYY